MKHLLPTLVLGTFLFAACGGETTDPDTTTDPQTEEVTEASLPADFLGNHNCPVSGNQVKLDQSVEHHGETIYFCCANCVAEGSKDLDATRNSVYAQATPVGNTMCPVMEDAEVDGHMASWQGHEVALCCSMCTEAFAETPEAFVRKAMASVE